MQTMHKVVGIMVASAGFSFVNVARATEMRFCNTNDPNDIYVAQGELGNGIFGATGYGNQYGSMDCNDYQTDGYDDVEWIDWYQVSPGTCVRIFNGCMTSDSYLWFAYDTAGAYWAGSGDNGQYNPISSSYHASDCCNQHWENPYSQEASYGPGIDQCQFGTGNYPDAQINYGPRSVDNLRSFGQLCATSQTFNLQY